MKLLGGVQWKSAPALLLVAVLGWILPPTLVAASVDTNGSSTESFVHQDDTMYCWFMFASAYNSSSSISMGQTIAKGTGEQCPLEFNVDVTSFNSSVLVVNAPVDIKWSVSTKLQANGSFVPNALGLQAPFFASDEHGTLQQIVQQEIYQCEQDTLYQCTPFNGTTAVRISNTSKPLGSTAANLTSGKSLVTLRKSTMHLDQSGNLTFVFHLVLPSAIPSRARYDFVMYHRVTVYPIKEIQPALVSPAVPSPVNNSSFTTDGNQSSSAKSKGAFRHPAVVVMVCATAVIVAGIALFVLFQRKASTDVMYLSHAARRHHQDGKTPRQNPFLSAEEDERYQRRHHRRHREHRRHHHHHHAAQGMVGGPRHHHHGPEPSTPTSVGPVVIADFCRVGGKSAPLVFEKMNKEQMACAQPRGSRQQWHVNAMGHDKKAEASHAPCPADPQRLSRPMHLSDLGLETASRPSRGSHSVFIPETTLFFPQEESKEVV